MADLARLKEQARGYEEDSRWEAALEIYERLVAEPATEEIGLWNRIGDLRLRLGDLSGAIEAYEHAADSYAEHGLLNNAIALCHKILRTVPERTSVYRKLGRLSAAHGFLADARQYVLTYSERMQRAGQGEQALAALRELAELAPDDPQIRQALAEQLRLREPAPEAETSTAEVSAQAEAHPEARSRLPAAAAGEDDELTLAPSARVQATAEVPRVEGLEPTGVEPQRYARSEQEGAGRAALEPEPVQRVDANDEAPLPPEEGEDAGEPLPLLGFVEELEAGAAALPPRAAVDPAPTEGGGRRGEGEPRGRREPAADQASRHYERGLALRSMGRFEDAIAEFQTALRHGAPPLPALEAVGECFIQKGQFSLAARVLERGLAVAGAEEQELIGIFYWLGRCQQALGRADLARDYLERVVSLDIRFRDAAALLESLDGASEA